MNATLPSVSVNARTRRYLRRLADQLGDMWTRDTCRPHVLVDDMGREIVATAQGCDVLRLDFGAPDRVQSAQPLNIVIGEHVAAVAACIRAEWLSSRPAPTVSSWEDVAAGALYLLGLKIAYAAAANSHDPLPDVARDLLELDRVGRYLIARGRRSVPLSKRSLEGT